MPEIRSRYDSLVIGGGIAGIQAALDLAEQGFEVLLVDKYPSIGGVMVGLNKVFPTLDCSSCICTPRMAESAHHPRIRLQTYTAVRQVEPVAECAQRVAGVEGADGREIEAHRTHSRSTARTGAASRPASFSGRAISS